MNNHYQNHSPINSDYNVPNHNNMNNLYRSGPPAKKENKKLNFKTMKKNTICSLNEVECFLNNLHHAIRCIKICKLFK